MSKYFYALRILALSILFVCISFSALSSQGYTVKPTQHVETDSRQLAQPILLSPNIPEQPDMRIFDPGRGQENELRYASEAISSNYAGYAAEKGGGSFSKVSGSWTMPAVKCPGKQSSEVAFWVGLTGRGGQSSIAQVATLGACQNGRASYEADWEFFPSTARTIGSPVQPGDRINAVVTYGSGMYHLSMSNARAGWSFSVAHGGSAGSASVAECITEAPTLIEGGTQRAVTNLANFGSVGMSCQANDAPIGSYAELSQYQMVAENATASTSGLDSAGSTFSVTWQRR